MALGLRYLEKVRMAQHQTESFRVGIIGFLMIVALVAVVIISAGNAVVPIVKDKILQNFPPATAAAQAVHRMKNKTPLSRAGFALCVLG